MGTLLKALNLTVAEKKENLDFLTSLAAQISASKTARLTGFTNSEFHILSHFGMTVNETLVTNTFDTAVLQAPNDPLIIEDSRKDERFAHPPSLENELQITFYAGIPLLNNDGKAIGMLSVMDDQPRKLTELQLNQLKGLTQQAEQLIELSKLKLSISKSKKQVEVLELAQRANQIGYWELEIETGKTVWSDVVYDIHEVPYDFDHNKVNGIDFYHPEYKSVILDAIVKCIENDEPFDVICAIITAKGNEKWVRSCGCRIGEQLIGSFQDITEIKKEELKFKGIFNSTFSFTGFLNTEGILLEANDTAIKITGLSREDFVGKYFWDCYSWQISDQTRNELILNFQKAVKGESVTYEVEVWASNKTPITILFSLKPVFNDLGHVEYVIPEGRPIDRLVKIRDRFKYVIEGTNIGTWEWNVQTGETIFNERWAEIVGYTLKELEPISINTWMKLAHPEDLEESDIRLQDCFEHRSEFYEMEARMRHKEGHWVWVLDRGKVIEWSSDGKPLKMYGTHEDVTAWKKQNEALRISEEAFRGNFESAGLGMALLDKNGKWLNVNKRLCEIIGYSEEELKNLTFQDITHPDDLEADLSLLDELVGGKRTHYSLEKRYFHKNGHLVYALLAVSLVRDRQGDVLYFISQIIDISEKKRVENQLKKILAENKAVMDATNQIILITTDEEGRITGLNSGAKQILSYQKKTLLGKNLRKTLINENEWNQIIENIPVDNNESNVLKYLSEKESSESIEITFKDAEGQFIPVLLSVSAIKLEGERKRFLFSAADISHVKSIQTQLERQNEKLEQFAYVAAHDMKEPLRGITTYLSVLQKKYADQLDEKAKSYIENAYENASRMKILISNILDYSKSGATGSEEVYLDKIVELIIKNYNQDGENIEVKFSKAQLPMLIGDPSAYIQLFTNLIDNGIKYQLKDTIPEISIDYMEDEKSWTFSVADNGIGIDPIHQSKVFEVFKRLHRESDFSGTGIGLATCKNIITTIGGKIWFEPNQTQGTIFKFTVPKN